MFAGQVMLGACVSLIVTVKEHAAVLPDESVAVQVTLLVPLLKELPEAGVQAVATPGQLSLAEAA